MNQIISYIYEYRDNQKIHNNGFLKVQFHYHKILVQIHMKGLALTNSESLTLFVFYKDGENAITKKLLDLPVKNKTIHMQFTLMDDFFPQKKHLQECDGFLFRGPYDEIYAASWMNVSLNTTKISAEGTVLLADTSDEPTEEAVLSSDAPDSAEGTVLLADIPEPSEKTVTAATDDSSSAKRTVPSAKVPSAKISRSELALLPRRYWNLANNSFLLHGYYNFHHLLLVTTDDAFILGIPGLYDKKEARAADLFGFPKFETKYLDDLSLSPNESCPQDNFGYWCRTIQRS